MSAKATIEIVLSNGQQAGKTINELTAQSAKLAREIKTLDTNSDAFITKSNDFKLISSRLKDVKKEAFNTAEAQSFLNSTFGDMVPFQGEFAKLGQGISISGKALKGAAGMAQLFKLALASTGIGLIVVALGSLYLWLNKTQAGLDFVQKVTKSFGAAVSVVVERLANFADGLIKIASGDLQGAWDSMKKSVSGFGDELAKETKATWANTGAMQALNQETGDLAVSKAKARAEIEKLKLASADQSKSQAQQVSSAKKAFEMEQSFLEQEIALQEKKLKLIAANNEKKGITLLNEDKQVFDDAEIELANLREQSFSRQAEIQNKINSIQKSGAAESRRIAREESEANKKASKEKLKMIEAEQKALEEFNKARDEFIKKSIESEIAANDARKTLNAEMLEGFKEQQQADFDQKLGSLVTMNEAEQDMINELFFTNQIAQEQREQMLYDSQKKGLEDRLALLLANGQQSSDAYQQLYMELLQMNYEHESKKTEQTQQEEEKRKMLQQQGLATAAGIFAGFAQLLSQDGKNRRKNLNAIKAAQVAEVGINAATEVQSIWKNANSFPPPFNFIIGTAQTLIALGRAKGAVQRINSVQIGGGESFADGGPVFGPSHAAGGIKFRVGGAVNEMEGGEIILTKGVYQNPSLREAASQLNVLGGGRSFALGGPVIRDRPMMNTSMSSPVSAAAAFESAQADGRVIPSGVEGVVEAYLAQIAEATMRTAQKPPLVLTEIQSRLMDLQNLENDAKN